MLFLLGAYQRRTDSFKDLNTSETCCLWTVNSGIRLGFKAGYAALGYALLSTTPMAATTLTVNAMVESAVIGTAIMLPIDICCSPVTSAGHEKDKDKADACAQMIACGPCSEVLDSVIVSLLGAQVQGLFASNVTTPAFVAAAGATGTAAVAGAVLAAVVVIGGITFCCVEMKDRRPAFLPTSCLPNFTCRDLVYPCELGLSICTREQMIKYIECCSACCPKPNTNPEANQQNAEPRSESMYRDDLPTATIIGSDATLPVAEVVDPNAPIPDAILVGGSSSMLTPSAPPLPAPKLSLV
jgi:hypothetical protein